MRTRLASIIAASAVALALAACGGDDADLPTDARRIDAAAIDAADIDAPDIDAAVDAAIDATPDATVDAATDAMPTNSELIGFARAAADGTVSLPIVGATVTYIKPQIGSTTNDPAGFTIQVAPTGPALMIAVDPTTLAPVPNVGDVVSFTITTMATTGGQRRATAISDFTRTALATDVNPLVQNITAATDVVTALDSYDSELIDVTGAIATNFVSAGQGFESAQITTTGIGVASASYLVRVPATLRSAQDMVMGCNFALNNTPVGRFNANAQLAAFGASDITLTGCPAPTVVGAIASSPTTVLITFTRNVLASSVLANGSQFTFDNGLTASAATVSGRTVTVTTSAQSNVTTYLATVAATVTDLQGTALGTPSTASFGGYVAPAVVKINEFNANVTGGCDLIELRVVAGGALTGFKLTERVGGSGELSFTFPALVLQTNDLVVVHTGSGITACNPNTATSETTGPAQQPSATFAGNYDTAYDFWNVDTGLTATDNVFTLFDGTNAIVDVVLTANLATGTAAAASETAAATAATANQWQMVGGGVPVGGFVDDNFRAHAALDLDGTDTTAAGTSIQRLDNTDDNDKADWNNGTTTVQNQTFGARNPGQTAL